MVVVVVVVGIMLGMRKTTEDVVMNIQSPEA